MSHTKTPLASDLGFIFVFEALHLLLLVYDFNNHNSKILLPGPLGATLLWPLSSTFPIGTASRLNWNSPGRGRARHTMHRNQSREPNSRDSANKDKQVRVLFLMKGKIL